MARWAPFRSSAFDNTSVALAVPPEIAAQRLAGSRVPDKFEAQPAEFFRRVAAGYAQRMQQNPQRIARIDADQTVEQVRQDVFATVRSREWLA